MNAAMATAANKTWISKRKMAVVNNYCPEPLGVFQKFLAFKIGSLEAVAAP